MAFRPPFFVMASMLAVLSASTAVHAALADPVPARLIVRYDAPEFAPGTAVGAAALQAAAARRVGDLSTASGRALKMRRALATGALLLDVGDGSPISATVLEQLAERIRRSAPPGLLSVEPDRLMQASLTPNDPQLANLWGVAGPAQSNGVAGVNAMAAWDTVSGAGAVVAIIDTGYRPHADLSGQVVAQYDFISDTTNSNDGGGRDGDAQDPGDYRTQGQCGASASTSSWHGTHVAGTVAAVGNNALGVVGVAYGAKLVIARVLGACGGYTSDIADAIVWASGGAVSGVPTNSQPAQVINMSLGGQYPCSSSPTLQSAITSARSRNTTVVVAAGNSSMDAGNFSPASCTGVISVASVGEAGGRAYYSNYGTGVDIAAPGGSSGSGRTILSTYNSGSTTPGSDSYAYLQGTSMACPHVAGVAGLLYALNPALTPDEVESAITSTARAFPASCSGCGSGLADAALALASITPGPGRLSFSASSVAGTEGGSSVTITVRRSGGDAGAVGVSYASANGTATAGSDYNATSGTLSWDDGDSADKTFSVTLLNDTTAESNETLTLSLSSPTGGATLTSPSTATLTIADDDNAPGTLALTSAAYSVSEAGGSVVVTVTRSGGDYGSASVNYVTANGTAAAGNDYTSRSGTLTWASRDAANKTISIPIANDTLAESTETLQLRLSAATGAALGSPSQATISIADNDTVASAGALSFTVSTASVAEGAGTAVITARRTGGSVGAVTVAYASANGSATAGSDYTATSGTLSWADGDAANKTFSVPISDDATTESAETITLTLSNATGGATLATPSTQTLTISDNDGTPGTIGVAATSVTIAENGGSAVVTVTRTGGSYGSASVNYVTANGSAAAGNDYTARSGTLTWASGDAANKTVSIPIANDTLAESTETLQLRLSAATGATLGASSIATVSITDDDTVASAGALSFTVSTASVAEGAGTAVITARRTGGSVGAVTVAYASANGSATAGSDYTATSGTLSWADGDAANKTFSVPISDDATTESAETITLTLSNATGGATLATPSTQTLTISDNDGTPGTIGVAATSVTIAENGGSAVVTVTRTGGSYGSASVNYVTANGSAAAGNDYTARSGTLTWASGDAANKTVSIPIANDTLAESTETLQLRLSAATGATLGASSIATVSITDDDTVSSAGALSFTSTALSASESVGNAVVTVRRSGGSLGAVSVAYASANGTAMAASDYAAASGTLNWSDGDAANKTFSVPISNDATAEANETITLSLSSPGGGATLGSAKTATLTIADDDGSPGSIVLSSASYAITEGTGAITITLQRTGGSTGAASINYVTANGTATAGNDYAAKSGTVTWANGDAANKSFTISVSNDTLTEPAETFQVRLSAPVTAALGATSMATVTINDND